MASESGNQAVVEMRRHHAAQESALRAVAAARGAVEKAQARRAAEVERLDAAVSDALGGEDEALAVLAELVPVAQAGTYARETVKRVREAQQRASAEVVSARVAALTKGLPVRRGPGRPRGSGRDSSGVVGAPLVGVDRAGDAAAIVAAEV